MGEGKSFPRADARIESEESRNYSVGNQKSSKVLVLDQCLGCEDHNLATEGGEAEGYSCRHSTQTEPIIDRNTQSTHGNSLSW